MKFIICIKRGTLLGNIWGGSLFFGGGGETPPQNRPPGSPDTDRSLFSNLYVTLYTHAIGILSLPGSEGNVGKVAPRVPTGV